MTDRPLVSFVVIAYRQERFVREAVRSALAQTYEPLEVIVCDDCSPDGTFDAIRAEVAAYRGPHTVIAHRQKANGGLARNLNSAWGMAHGELVVVQGGDDISLPHRTQRLVAAWHQEPAVDCLFSDCAVIDAEGAEVLACRFGANPPQHPESIEHVLERKTCWVMGCSAAYAPELMRRYGGLDADVIAEDNVLPFRALLGRGIRYIDEVLIRYRVHGSNIFHGTAVQARKKLNRAEARRWAMNKSAISHQWLRDWDRSGRQDARIRATLEGIIRERCYDARAYDSSRAGALRLAVQGLCDGLPLRKTGGLIKRHVLRMA